MSERETSAAEASTTVLDRPEVREYLRLLDLATASLPGPQARELREQISAHLEDALSPAATSEEVKAELRRLGPPRGLAREAEGPLPHPALTRLGRRLRRVRWWAWTAIGTAAVAITAWVAVIQVMENAAPLSPMPYGWLYPQDYNHAVNTSADMANQTTISVRLHQQQGIGVYVFNNSDWTVTVLGPAPNWIPVGSQSPVRVLVETGPHLDRGGNPLQSASYVTPGSVPPHSNRLLRIVWTSQGCNLKGGEYVIDTLILRVRVGIVTRTETIPLSVAFALEGTAASQALCGH
ncbi:MAG: hypothetical protein JWM19_5633 [Actinomycetia bacterium]|nr:hypothetical protein [Actinomycetes bacterium]